MEQGAVECTDLLDIMAQNAPEFMIGSGIVESVFKVMTTYKHDDSVLASCITALERVSRKQEGMNEIVQSNGIHTVLGCLSIDNTEKDDDANPEHLVASFSLLKRYTATGDQAIEYVRQCGGVDAIINALEGIEIGSDNKIMRQGGQLLTKIAGNDLEGALDKLKNGGDIRTTLALISNLALEAENIDTIVQAGGIDALVTALTTDTGNVSTVKATSLALSRIAAVNENHIDAILSSGGIQALLNALNNSAAMDADVTAAGKKIILNKLPSTGSTLLSIDISFLSISVIIRIIFCNLNCNINFFFYLIILNISFNLLQNDQNSFIWFGIISIERICSGTNCC